MGPRKNTETIPEAAEYNVQEQFEDLAAQQLDLRSVMDERHQELRLDMDRRQVELMRLVQSLKDSVDGMRLHQQAKDRGAASSLSEPLPTVGHGILGPNPFHAGNHRNHNLLFPRFNGENLKTWLYRIDQYFVVDETLVNHRLRLVAMNLEDEALAWHQAFLRCRDPPNVIGWDEYLRAITETFGDDFADPMLELKQLRQTGTVREFQFAFSRLLTQCNLTTAQAISCFLGGLKDELVGTILMHEPQTLSKVFRLARLTEATQLANARSQNRASGLQGGVVKKQHQETLVTRPQPIN
ncbi:hypothetical protein KY290_015524 [Solanum tuberosum]|uniref:Retrotransposon gag domain-containing protein n=1 Tax=Solanum tuberosum TaxID=4113 RepID=A0ABQ7VSY9_SOLTU|nr:hypothetical protein KY289_015123 [Solanum tuberosum]KAH0700666.1 hypothetical protein KY284_014881 [Solanum tuberosum]KAH0718869.1 hypothetical protein KY285_014900 [Solanum tuberosum]KAH0771543.1 hypothetical protein KY290_015524 [Solanum tuberosum]